MLCLHTHITYQPQAYNYHTTKISGKHPPQHFLALFLFFRSRLFVRTTATITTKNKGGPIAIVSRATARKMARRGGTRRKVGDMIRGRASSGQWDREL